MLQKINISLLIGAAFILGMVISDYGNSNNSGYRHDSPYVVMKDSDIRSMEDLQNQPVSAAQNEQTFRAIFEDN